MKRELKEYGYAYAVQENGNDVFTMFTDGDWVVRTFDDRGNYLTSQWNDGTKYEWTWDENDELLTRTFNGKLIIDNRPKDITITLTKSQLNKIRKAGLL